MGDERADDRLTGPETSPTARRLVVNGFFALWRGQRPNISDLTDDPAIVEALVGAGRLEIDDHGLLVGVHGLTLRPTAHRIEHVGGVVHTWCALDAIGIPAALSVDAAAVTSCPLCRAPLRVTLRDGVTDDEGDLRLWIPGGECAHLLEDFCRHANLFCSAEHLASKIVPGTIGEAVTVTDAATIGRMAWSDVAAVQHAPEGDES